MWIQSPGLPVGWEEDAINLICVTLTSENQRQDSLPLIVLHWQTEQSVQNPDLIMSLFSLKSCNIYLSPRGIPSKLIPWHLVLPSLLVKFISCFPQESQSPSYPELSQALLCPSLKQSPALPRSCHLTPPHTSAPALIIIPQKVVPGPAPVPWWCRCLITNHPQLDQELLKDRDVYHPVVTYSNLTNIWVNKPDPLRGQLHAGSCRAWHVGSVLCLVGCWAIFLTLTH